MSKYLVVTFEAAWPIESTDIHDALESALSGLRSEGAARAVKYDVLASDEEYEHWYASNDRINEVEILSPTVISFDT